MLYIHIIYELYPWNKYKKEENFVHIQSSRMSKNKGKNKGNGKESTKENKTIAKPQDLQINYWK